MKLKHILASLALLAFTMVGAQGTDGVLLTIEGNTISVSEFMAIYNKNNVEIESADKKSVEDYLELYLNFKLKVHEAEVQGYDTISSFKNELGGYVDQLAAPYLVDNQFTEDLIKEAYNRSKFEIRARHIMIKIPENPTPSDTLKAWNKINAIAKDATDSSFTDLAVKYSEDPSVAQNKGDLGYFTVFRMVYPFESAAYNTPVGSVSKPIRTTYGYHIIKVEDKIPARGEIKAAHIMIISNDKSTKDEAEKAKKKITEIYNELKAGAAFAKLANTYSDDRGSAQKGGDLGWFGAGKMVPLFEEKAFSLKNAGDYTDPFLTQFGWHIVKLEDRKNIGTYEEEYENFKKKVKSDRRSLGSEHALVVKLMSDYNVKVKSKTKDAFYNVIDSTYFENKWEVSKAKGLSSVMITISDKTYGKKKATYTQADFAAFLQSRMRGQKKVAIPMLVDTEFKFFVDEKIIEYEKTVLALKYPEYKALVTEYHDGILLFEIMEKEVWKKAMADSAGLAEFFDANQSKYMWETRLDAKMYICKDQSVATNVLKMVEENKNDSTIIAETNKNSELSVTVRSGKYQKGQEDNLKSVKWEKGISTVTSGNNVIIVNVLDVLAAEPKKMKEVKGLVTSAYQDELDEQWVKELRKKYSYTINQEALNAAIK